MNVGDPPGTPPTDPGTRESEPRIRPGELRSERIGSFSLDVLNALSSHVAVLDAAGRIVAINQAWRQFAEENGGDAERLGVGSDYFAACTAAMNRDDIVEARVAIEGIRQVLSGESDGFEMEYGCHGPNTPRWFLMRVHRMGSGGTKAVVSHIDITTRKLAEERLLERENELSALHVISRAGSSSISLDGVAAAILEQIDATLNPDLVLLFIREGQELRLQGVGPKGNPLDVEMSHAHRVGQCLCGLSVKSRKAIFSKDIHNDSRCSWQECKEAGVTSFAAVPLIHRDEVIGTLGIASLAMRDFAEHEDFLGAMANDVAMCVANALWCEKARSYARDLEHQLLETQRVERALRQSRKMEAIGNLAGGIAHDFNNILAPIVGYTELVLEDLRQSDPSRANLEMVLKAAERARSLVRQILACARQVEGERVPVEMSEPVREAIALLRPSLPSTIDLVERIDDDLPTIRGDATQIYQVVLNLCTNAARALEDQGGTLEVSLEHVDLDSEFTVNQRRLPGGAYLRMTVEDSGVGMPSEILESIFDPYFTTDTEGTGLGLAVAHGVVKSHGGEISVYSEPGAGTRVSVYFPAITATPRQSAGEPRLAPGGSESILVVDDEVAVVDMSRQVLEKFGYEVTAVTESLEARRLFESDPGRFDAVVSDMTMPGMRGDQLARELLAIRPDIAIVLCTGFSRHLSSDRVADLGVHGLLMKPFTRRELAMAVRNALDSTS